MYQQEKVLTGVNVRTLSRFLVFGGLATMLPFFIHIQWVTGPLVNALLIITLFLVGFRYALLLCFIPSLMALAGGLIPLPLAPVIPFIMASNAILVLFVDRLYSANRDNQRGYWIGIAVGAAMKYAFLALSLAALSQLLAKSPVVVRAAALFSWPQLVTALAGGLIAWTVLKWLKRL
jgi:hypothetical protein